MFVGESDRLLECYGKIDYRISCTGYSLIKKDGREGWVAKSSLR